MSSPAPGAAAPPAAAGAAGPAPASERLRPLQKLAYGSGAFGFSVANTMFLLYFSIFLTDVVGLAPMYVAVIQLMRKGWDAVNDPIAGMITDRARTRWGRRRPFILFGFVPFGIFFALLWQRPLTTTPWGTVAWFVVIILLYDTATTAVWVPYNALTPEMTRDYDERTSLNGYRQAFSMVGGLVAAGAVEQLVKAFAPAARGHAIVGWMAGTLAALPFLLVFLGVRERWQAPAGEGTQPGLVAMFRTTLRNRAFLVALLVYILSWMSVGIASTMFVYFLKHWMKMEGRIWIVLLTVQLSALCFIPLIVWASKRLGKKGAYIIGISFWAVVQVSMVFLQPAHAIYAVALAACAGIGLGTAHVLPWSMIPDCIELDELETGQRREGAYYGVMAFVEKAGSALALVGVNTVLQIYGYDGTAPVQTEAARWAVRLLMGPGPALLLVLSIGAALFYPISRARHAAVRRALADRA